jgi:hypothetical protein
MRVLRVHFRAGMAGQFLPEFLRDACIRHCRDETMPETVKAFTQPIDLRAQARAGQGVPQVAERWDAGPGDRALAQRE